MVPGDAPIKCEFCGQSLKGWGDSTPVKVNGVLVIGCRDRLACQRRREEDLLLIHKRMNEAYEDTPR